MMYVGIAAPSEDRDSPRTSREEFSALLISACRLLASTPPELASACSVSGSVSSDGQLALLALEAERIAAQHGVVSTVTVCDGRLQVRFVRSQGAPKRRNAAY
jgi:hypothetical protein